MINIGKDLQDAFDDGYEKGKQDNSWISISERLPEENKHVLLFMRSHEGQEMQVVGYLFYSNKERLRGFNGEFAVALKEVVPEFLKKEYVLAWQSLPEPYREG